MASLCTTSAARRSVLIGAITCALAGCAATPAAPPPPNALELLLNSPPASPAASKAEIDAAVKASDQCM